MRMGTYVLVARTINSSATRVGQNSNDIVIDVHPRYLRRLRDLLRENTVLSLASEDNTQNNFNDDNNIMENTSLDVSIPHVLTTWSHHELPMSADVNKMLVCDNAGGSSVISEAASVGILSNLLRLTNVDSHLHKLEMEIEYKEHGSITDYSMKIRMGSCEEIIGCSVVRMFDYRDLQGGIPDEEIIRLLKKKLNGIISSTNNVMKHDRWSRQVLHIFSPNNDVASNIGRLLRHVKDIMLNTIVVITVTSMRAIYFDMGDSSQNTSLF